MISDKSLALHIGGAGTITLLLVYYALAYLLGY